jgi:hypothetical protein
VFRQRQFYLNVKKKDLAESFQFGRLAATGKKEVKKKKKVPYLKKGQKGRNKGIARRQSALSRPFFRLIQSLMRCINLADKSNRGLPQRKDGNGFWQIVVLFWLG